MSERDKPHIRQARVEMTPDERMNVPNAARYLGRPPSTLKFWRYRDSGPRFVRVGRGVFYFKADLDAFIGARPSAAE
jgi:hypothetical protein